MDWHSHEHECNWGFSLAVTLAVAVPILVACGPAQIPDEELQTGRAAAEAGLSEVSAHIAEGARHASTQLDELDSMTKQRVPVSCASVPSNGWVLIADFSTLTIHEYYQFAFVSSTPTFNVSETRVAINDLSTPISVTFTSQQSQTFTISASASMSAKLFDWLTLSVSGSIQQSTTTSVGISTTASVPAFRTVRGEYGVSAYDVVYNVRTVRRERRKSSGFPSSSCWDLGVTQQATNAPTNDEGWRVTLVP
jgi:hypothetical protein